MKCIRLDLLTLLVSLFILNSCENPDSIGLDIDPANKIKGDIETQEVTASTVKEDSLITSGLSQHPLGNVEDPVFGRTQAGIAMALSFKDSSKVTFGTAPKLLSAELVLRYGTEFYGDSVNTEYTVNIHQLSEKYNTGKVYYNTSKWNYAPDVIGSKTLSYFALKDSINIHQWRRGKADTIIRVPPQLRIPINSTFIESSFFNAAATNFSTNAKFAEYFKGVYIKLEKNEAGKGGVVFFTPDTSSRLELVYERQNGTRKDTNIVRFSIGAAASSISHDYSGTIAAEQLSNPGQQYSTVLVQPMGGLRTKLHFPQIQELKSLGNIAINKAELVIYTDENETYFSPSPRLTLYRTDIAAQRQNVPDGYLIFNNGSLSLGDSRSATHPLLFGGFYDKTKKRYIFNLTSYVQDILSGKLQQYDTFIAPVAFSSADIPTSPSALTAAPAVLNNEGSNKMKLNIIYTSLE